MNNENAIAFLEKWNPTGPWVLTAIRPDKKGIETRTFKPDTIEGLKFWLQTHNGERNIYFHVNSALQELSTKANREDIKSLDWLHIDIDPAEGADLNAERDRCLGLLTDNLPQDIPPPTCIIFSGGGYQGFWKLEEPVAIDGDLGLAEEAKRWNQQLEILFGGDNCHNIDRIMRLPGTMNLPDAKKLKKGRTIEEAKLIEFNTSLHKIENFEKASKVQIDGDTGFSAKNTVEISGNIARVAELDELDEWDVPDRVKVIIAQGRHPEQPKNGDNSRSSWLFDCVCQLIRAEVPDEVIYSIITDAEWGIAASVVECGSAAGRYAVRQIERAKEWAVDPNLVKLNDQFAVIGNMGGKCRIIEEVYDKGLNRTRLTKQSFEDFRNRYSNILIKISEDAQGNAKFMPLGKWWLGSIKRRQYDYLVFAPGDEVGDNYYNLWKGFACESKPGPHEAFMDHVRTNVCSGNEELINYVIGWMARTVQQPGTPGEVAIVMRGKKGTGKSFFAKQFGKLFGRHYLQVSNSSHLVGNFNAHLRDTIVLFADEAFYANDKKHASVLQTLITEETIPIEAKGVDVETAPNYVHLIMASNAVHVIPASSDERRFLVLDVGEEHQKDLPYFNNISKIMNNGGREALLHYLMNYDISDFQVRDVPDTDALQEQKLLSLSVEEEWWYQKLCEGRLCSDHARWNEVILKNALVNDYIDNARRFNVNRRGTATSLGRFLNRMVPQLAQKQMLAEIEKMGEAGFTYIEKKRAYHYVFPPLEECRTQWERLFGSENWPQYEEYQEELKAGTGVAPF